MDEYLIMLRSVQNKPKALQSDFSRKWAREVGEAASRGHITVLQAERPTNFWRITASGMALIGTSKGVEPHAKTST